MIPNCKKIENRINKNAEEIEKIEGKTSGISKISTAIQPGAYYQIPFLYFCGFASYRVYTGNYEYFKIYSVIVSNKYASRIEELESYLFNNNANVSITFEILDGNEGDDLKYIRISNSGSIPVQLSAGVQNML